jgi:putative tricarboxylic transport membrane protein
MKTNFYSNRDFLSGLHFLFFGGIGWWMARDYPFGSALRMGPGYFPTVLSVMMILAGIWFVIKGMRSSDWVQGNWSIRALIVLPLSTVIFGILMEEVGFIPAMIGLVYVSAASGKEFNWLEVTLLTIGLTVACAAGFIYGLGLPYPLIKGVWGY